MSTRSNNITTTCAAVDGANNSQNIHDHNTDDSNCDRDDEHELSRTNNNTANNNNDGISSSSSSTATSVIKTETRTHLITSVIKTEAQPRATTIIPPAATPPIINSHSLTNSAENKWSKNGYGQPCPPPPQNGKFSPDESAIVRTAINDYCTAKKISTSRLCSECDHKAELKGAWMEIAKRLPHRTVQSVYRHGLRQLHPFKRGAWTAAECTMLHDLVGRMGKKWSQIQGHLRRSADSCRDKYREMSGSYVKGRWKEGETEILKRLVREFLKADPHADVIELARTVEVKGIVIPWSMISRRMGKRSRLSCFKKWQKMTGVVGDGGMDEEGGAGEVEAAVTTAESSMDTASMLQQQWHDAIQRNIKEQHQQQQNVVMRAALLQQQQQQQQQEGNTSTSAATAAAALISPLMNTTTATTTQRNETSTVPHLMNAVAAAQFAASPMGALVPIAPRPGVGGATDDDVITAAVGGRQLPQPPKIMMNAESVVEAVALPPAGALPMSMTGTMEDREKI